MTIKFNPTKILNYFFFLSTFALLSYTNAVYVSKGISSGFLINLKYVTLLLGMLFCFLQIVHKNKSNFKSNKRVIYVKELKNILLVATIFLFISLCFSLFTGKFTSNTISEIFKIVLPVLYAFGVLNTFNFKDIYNCMIGVLFLSMGGYILEVGVGAFTIDSIKSISFTSSYSPFESHYAAGASIAMCTFFMYYREKPVFKYLSLIFAVLTFKRVSVIFSLIIFILPIIVDVNKVVKKRWLYVTKLFFILATYIYYWIISPYSADVIDKILKMSADDFTMGRSKYIGSLVSNNFSSYGFGSTTVFLNKNLEMDLIKISIELSFIGLVLFINFFWNITQRNLYAMVYMFFIFTNLLTSHSLTNSFSWILTYIIIGCILHKRNNDLSYLRYKKKNKVLKIRLH